jgi:Flp pilus assembly protein TadG
MGGSRTRWISHARGGERGASLVEFAIVFPLFALLVLGVVDFGLALHSRGLVANAAREAARHGAVGGTLAEMEARARDTADSLDQSRVTVTITCTKPDASPCSFSPSNVAAGDVVSTRVDYSYPFITPLLFSSSMTVSADAQMRYEG